MNKKKILFIKWFPYDKRNEAIASSIGAKCFFVHSLKYRNKWNALLRYAFQFIKTLLILLKEKPKTIFVTNPPIFATATIAIFCGTYKADYIIDSHTGAFEPKWDFVKFLHKYLSRKAKISIITNNIYEKIYQNWGAKTFILSDLVVDIPKSDLKRKISMSEKFNIIVISSFAPDEPIEEILAAANQLSNVTFYVTGNFMQCKKELRDKKPKNVFFTGFLPDQEYFDLLHDCHSIMVLVDKDNTMQQGAYESLSVKKPMILSNWRVLREIYNKGTVFVENNEDSIKKGITLMIDQYNNYLKEIDTLYEERKNVWIGKCKFLMTLINS
ncbi:hypothetical protein K8R14_05540 [bacterium]|nr:hypothetical protein [bacterium]